jgi:membrane protease YdiL (CAAX protease family)
MYRQHSPKKLATDCDGKIFGQFFILGCFLIPMIFGIKMLILDFSLTISPRLYFFLGKSLLGAMALSFLEEWLFRGLIFKILLNPVKPFLATIFSSLLFAYFHFRPHYEPNPSSRFATLGDGFHCLYEVTFRSLVGISWFKFSIIFSLGCLLATVYFRTRNLLASVGLHGAIVFTLMIFREWIYFPATNFFFGSNDLFNSPLALLVILFFTISFSAYYTHFYSQKS